MSTEKKRRTGYERNHGTIARGIQLSGGVGNAYFAIAFCMSNV